MDEYEEWWVGLNEDQRGRVRAHHADPRADRNAVGLDEIPPPMPEGSLQAMADNNETMFVWHPSIRKAIERDPA